MKSHAKTSCAAIALTMLAASAYAAPKPEYKSKLSGYEFGVGIPLVTPLTGYNVFVGYVNKNASTFLGRRFGIRLDFTISSELSLNGNLSDKEGLDKDGKTKYVLDANGKVLGIDLKISDFSKKGMEIEAFEDDDKKPIKIGKDAIDFNLNIKNQNFGLLVDFYPFADTWFLGGIRLTGGYYVGDFDISAKANIKNDIDYRYKVGDRGDILHAQIAKGSTIGADFRWKYRGPYAGLGFDLGIWHGFKFFMDAGVVFAHAPKVTKSNIHDDDFVLKGRYEVNGATNSDTEMVEIIHGAQEAPDVEQIIHDTVSITARDILTNQTGIYGDIKDKLPISDTDVGEQIIAFLNDKGAVAEWINDLPADSDLKKTLDEIKSGWQDGTSKIQKDINKIYDDYDKNKTDAIKDANKFLKDYGMMPMVKIGFMYRF